MFAFVYRVFCSTLGYFCGMPKYHTTLEQIRIEHAYQLEQQQQQEQQQATIKYAFYNSTIIQS